MKKILIILLSVMCLNITACVHYEPEIAELYSIEKYKIYEEGVEFWAVSESGAKNGFFVKHENVYNCEDSSRVIALYSSYGCFKNAYLYFCESDMKDYIKEKYDIE